jgi:hypothetical protein
MALALRLPVKPGGILLRLVGEVTGHPIVIVANQVVFVVSTPVFRAFGQVSFQASP